MKRYTTLITVSIILTAALACNFVAPQAEETVIPSLPQNSAAPLTEDDVPRIGVAEAKAAFDSGQAVIVDVRSAEAYLNKHAAGAVSIPLDRFEININTIPLEKEQWIITYCT